jgi:hypothetical protein
MQPLKKCSFFLSSSCAITLPHSLTLIHSASLCLPDRKNGINLIPSRYHWDQLDAKVIVLDINFPVRHFPSLCLTLPHSASLCLTLPHSASLCLTLPHSASLCLTFPHSASFCLIVPHSASLSLTLPHFAS